MIFNLFIKKQYFDINKNNYLKDNNIFLESNYFDLFVYNKVIGTPSSLSKLKDYLPYIKRINIFLDLTLSDFVNLIYIVDYLTYSGYKCDIFLNYYHTKTLQDIIKKDFNISFRENTKNVIKYLRQEINKIDSKLQLSIPNFNQSIMLFTGLFINKNVINMIINECIEKFDDLSDSIEYFKENYPEYGLEDEYIKKLFEGC